MNMSNYFDLEEIWVNELVGDVWLFLFVGVIMIWLVCIKCKTPFQIPALLTVLFSGIVFSIATNTLLILWFMAILAVGFMFYYGLSKALR